MLCTLCERDVPNPKDMFVHFLEHADTHKEAIEYINSFVREHASYMYAFEISEALCGINTELEYSTVPTKLFPAECINTITKFVALLIPYHNFYHRRKVGTERENDETNSTNKNKSLLQLAGLSLNFSERRKLMTALLRQNEIKFTNNYNLFGLMSPEVCCVCGTVSEAHTHIHGVPVCYNKCDKIYKESKQVSVTKLFTFAAAHHLPYHEGLCRFTHGHEWLLEVTVKRPLHPESEMVLDFSELKAVVNTHIINVLDHNYINDLLYNPTAENITMWIWEKLSDNGLYGLDQIKLWEAPTSFAVLTEKDMK